MEKSAVNKKIMEKDIIHILTAKQIVTLEAPPLDSYTHF